MVSINSMHVSGTINRIFVCLAYPRKKPMSCKCPWRFHHNALPVVVSHHACQDSDYICQDSNHLYQDSIHMFRIRREYGFFALRHITIAATGAVLSGIMVSACHHELFVTNFSWLNTGSFRLSITESGAFAAKKTAESPLSYIWMATYSSVEHRNS